MNKEFIPVLQALELKELGYREQTLAYYSNDFNLNGEFELRFAQDSGDTIDWNEPNDDGNYIAAPLYQQAFAFLRGKVINYIQFENDYMQGNFVLQPLVYFDGYIIQVLNVPTSAYINEKGQEAPYYGIPWHIFKEPFSSFAEAELACLKKLIEIIKNK